MAEQGTVKKVEPQGRFGWITRPNGSELFFHKSAYPKGVTPAAGDMVEYAIGNDPSKPAGKQEFAAGIKVITKAATPPGTQTSASPGASGQKLEAKFTVYRPTVVTDQNVDYWQVPVEIQFLRGTEPVAGLQVTLECNNQSATFPVDTMESTAEGKVRFVAAADKDVPVLYFKAKASDGTTDYTRTEVCDPRDPALPEYGKFAAAPAPTPATPPPAPATPAPAPAAASAPATPAPTVKKISAEKLRLQDGAIYFRVTTREGEENNLAGVSADFLLVTDMDIVAEVAQSQSGPFASAANDEGATGPNGVGFVRFWVKPSSPHGNIYFEWKGTNQKSENHYISNSWANAARPPQNTGQTTP